MKLVRPKNYILTLLIVSIALFFSHLNILFVEIMEARNFITAREMLTYDNWLLTTLNLEPRYEKPPLPTWFSAISGMLFGIENLLAMRAPAALSGVFMVLFLYFFSNSLFNDKKQSFINSLILATSFYIIFIARDGTWDVFAHSFMLGAIWFLFQFFESDKFLWRNIITASILFGLSFLSKGPVAVFSLLIPFLVAYALIFKFKNFKPKWNALALGIVVATILSSWWFLYVYIKDAANLDLITNNEKNAWSNRHTRPWYHYWSFPIQTGIWVIPAIISLLYPYLKSRIDNLKVYQFTLIWTVVGIILLSVVPEKKERYLVPVLIPMAINIGFYIKYLIQKGKNLSDKMDLFLAYFGLGTIGMVALIIPFAAYIFLKENLTNNWTWFIIMATFSFLFGIFIIIQLKRKNFGVVFTTIIAFQVSILVVGFPLVKSFYNNDNFKNINEAHLIEKNQQIKSYSFGSLAPELIWEYDRVIKDIYQHNTIQLPTENTFGLFVNEDQYKDFKTYFENDYHIKYITRFDLNYIINKKKLHRTTRLLCNYYILKKINKP